MKKFFTSILLVFILSTTVVEQTHALGLPFGGRVGFTWPYCLNGFYTVVIGTNAMSSGPFLIPWTAIWKPMYNPYTPGNYIKGSYLPAPIPCFFYCGIWICTIPTRGTIVEFGTSLVPGI